MIDTASSRATTATAEAQVQLSLQDLRKTYGEMRAVDGVTLDLRKGEFLTLLGSSGSGKTTTLMMAAGFIEPTSGTIQLDGADVTRRPAHKRGMGMVFQNHALFPHMTAAGNVEYPLKLRGVARRERETQVAEALATVGLGGLGARYPRELSGGQQQRVALARALVFKPPVLLMDEPLSALDKRLRVHMQEELRQLHTGLGVTILYVTHDQEEALVLSDRIAVMDHGRIQQIGSPREIYECPQSAFVAGFIGESNFLRGVVLEHRQGAPASVRLDGGDVVVCDAPAVLAEGARAVVAIRPERLAFDGHADDAQNHLSAVLTDANYVGGSVLYRFRTSDDVAVTVRAQHSGPLRVGIGESLTLNWNHHDGIALAAPDAS